MKTLQRPLQLYILIVALYAVLMGWWVYFLTTEGEWLVREMARAGAELSPDEAAALRAVTARTGRMFLYESLFLGLLMVGSVWLVLRSLRQARSLKLIGRLMIRPSSSGSAMCIARSRGPRPCSLARQPGSLSWAQMA